MLTYFSMFSVVEKLFRRLGTPSLASAWNMSMNRYQVRTVLSQCAQTLDST